MFFKILFLFFLFQNLVWKILASRNYEKWKLIEVRPASRNASSWHKVLNRLETWEHLRVIDTKDVIKIGIGPDFQFRKLEKLSRKFKLKTKLLHDDISKLIGHVHRKAKRSVSEDHFDRYMDYEKMENFFSILQSSYPETIKREIIGRSYEGRNISLFIISSNKNQGICKQTVLPDATNHFNIKIDSLRNSNSHVQRNQQNQRSIHLGNSTHNFIYFNIDILKFLNRSEIKIKKEEKFSKEKPIIFIDAGLHSREWICPAVALYLIKHLAENPALTSRIDWFIVPLANPDGYKFSWNGDRFWRKTRSKSGTSGCYGADMNRNFDFHWSQVDTSKNPCSEHYGGTGPNSEVETVVISEALRKQKHRLKAYISLHNWGQQILYPYSYNEVKTPRSEAEMNRVGEGMVHAIKKAQNTDYHTGRGSVLLYPASGTSIDWAYDVLGVPYSYLIELRDSFGRLGFLLTEDLIKPTGADMFAAMKFLANEILQSRNNSCG